MDMDNYRGGFATWSGTSFAAPVLAGEIAQRLIDSDSLDADGVGHTLDRTWNALTPLVGLDRPTGP
jgi:subtilisin family serine protease